MIVYRISKCIYIYDLKGTGAATYGGRWHSKGTFILYTAATPSLALLESVVHIATVAASGFCMISLEIPEDKIQELSFADLPLNWYLHPPPKSLKSFGDLFIKENKYLALKLPSAIMHEESNYLLNSNHSDFKLVKVLSKRDVAIDERLLNR